MKRLMLKIVFCGLVILGAWPVRPPTLTAFDKGDDGRCRALAFRVCNDYRFVALHDGDTAVGGTQINSMILLIANFEF